MKVTDVRRDAICPGCGEPITVTFKVEAAVVVTEGAADLVISTMPVGSPIADHMVEFHPELID